MPPHEEPQLRFSRRTAWDRSASEMVAPADVSASILPLLDLTASNPTVCGIGLDAAAVLEPLSQTGALVYEPDPRGMVSAREAVAGYYERHGARVSAEQIVLTASTSEAYGHLFRLVCDPGDEVLIAQPSYPLFDTLAELSDVVLRPYPLFYDHGWWIDVATLGKSVTSRTRAIVVVHPNNPTGHATTAREREMLQALCRQHGLCLIVDEVFLDYAHAGLEAIVSFAGAPAPALTFVLSGLSKIACLPQMKLGWIVAMGPEKERNEAMARLEIIADTFLSVNTPAQQALPAWLAYAPRVQDEVLGRIAENLELLRGAGMEWFAVEAGWSAMLRVPRILEEDTAFTALRRLGIVTHPAHFYGLDDAARVVISLIVPVERMRLALERVAARLGAAKREG